MPRARFAISENSEHPGTRTIFSDRGRGWHVVRRGRFSDIENDEQITRLKRQGIEVGELKEGKAK